MNALLILLAEDEKAPAAKDVVAGWTGFTVFLLLILAVALLCWSMVRQLRKAQAAKNAGVYGDEPVSEATDDEVPTDAADDAETTGSAPDRDA